MTKFLNNKKGSLFLTIGSLVPQAADGMMGSLGRTFDVPLEQRQQSHPIAPLAASAPPSVDALPIPAGGASSVDLPLELSIRNLKLFELSPARPALPFVRNPSPKRGPLGNILRDDDVASVSSLESEPVAGRADARAVAPEGQPSAWLRGRPRPGQPEAAPAGALAPAQAAVVQRVASQGGFRWLISPWLTDKEKAIFDLLPGTLEGQRRTIIASTARDPFDRKNAPRFLTVDGIPLIAMTELVWLYVQRHAHMRTLFDDYARILADPSEHLTAEEVLNLKTMWQVSQSESTFVDYSSMYSREKHAVVRAFRTAKTEKTKESFETLSENFREARASEAAFDSSQNDGGNTNRTPDHISYL